ncbi:MAG: DUF2442 domain-containing protein [Cyclobacteriaceae bacterium]|nr:DUF2442 domain-containing protein [Cyclobacteriaceae bacterium]
MNKIIPYLKSATALPGWKLMIEYEDGLKGIIDLKLWKEKKGVFTIWEDEENFKRFRITPDKKIEWNDEVDMDPDAFYLQLIGKTFEEYASDKQVLRYSR